MKNLAPNFLRASHRGLRYSRMLVAILLACAFFVHIFDACSAHLGIFATPTVAQHIIATQHDETAFCDTCEIPSSSGDVCEISSEIAVLSTAQQQIDQSFIAASPNWAILSFEPPLIYTIDSFLSRAGPTFIASAQIDLHSALPTRAPPVSL